MLFFFLLNIVLIYTSDEVRYTCTHRPDVRLVRFNRFVRLLTYSRLCTTVIGWCRICVCVDSTLTPPPPLHRSSLVIQCWRRCSIICLCVFVRILRKILLKCISQSLTSVTLKRITNGLRAHAYCLFYMWPNKRYFSFIIFFVSVKIFFFRIFYFYYEYIISFKCCLSSLHFHLTIAFKTVYIEWIWFYLVYFVCSSRNTKKSCMVQFCLDFYNFLITFFFLGLNDKRHWTLWCDCGIFGYDFSFISNNIFKLKTVQTKSSVFVFEWTDTIIDWWIMLRWIFKDFNSSVGPNE